MKNLFAIVALCVATVAMAQPVVDVYLDVTDPSNVTFTCMAETSGAYAGWFGIDAIEIEGATKDLVTAGPFAFGFTDAPFDDLGIVDAADGIITAFNDQTIWVEYGVTYSLGDIATSSNPNDYSCLGGQTGYFRVVDANDVNGYGDGSGSGNLLGQVVPEPASMSMLALGALAMIRRRR